MAGRLPLAPLVFLIVCLLYTVPIQAQTTDQSLSSQAHAKYDAGELAQAETLFTQLLTDRPSSALAPDAQHHLGWIAYKLQKNKVAETRWQAVVDRYPTSPEAPKALMGIAAVHYKAGKGKDDRIADFQRVLTLYPNSPEAQEARLRIGIIHRHRPPDFTQALAILDDLIANCPDQKWKAEAYVEKGLTLQQRYWNQDRVNVADRDDALTIFRTTREMFAAQADSVARAELHLAKHYLYRENDPAGARTILQEILKAYPETGSTAEILYQIAYCSHVEKDYDRCIQLCEDIIRTRPASDWNCYLQYFVGSCHESAGRKAEARVAFAKTVSLYPATDWAKLAENALSRLAAGEEAQQ